MDDITRIDPNFTTVIHKLSDQANTFCKALHNIRRRLWDTFNYTLDEEEKPVFDDEAVNPFDSDSIHTLFSRDQATENYIDTHTTETEDNGRVGRAVGSKIQIDMLAGIERDFRSRYMPRVRMMAHQATRQRGLSSSQGTLLLDVVRWAKMQAEKLPARQEST